ncbi:MAG TPA: biotin/lipoate A/B protein ligase family protein [Candidatus Bilamarchaeum sp.]|nr:biotin/lipoate A/B protein ligase family protein [Candidatus Bilamarchaeum sp.]
MNVPSIRWRIIDYTENDAFMNMAIDEAVSGSVAAGGPPTIRFYGWRPPAVSIGYFQSLEKEIDLEACRRAGVDFVRRRTGGGAVYHDTDGEITYSVIAGEDILPRDIIASYRVICGWILRSLSIIGIEAEFKPINDIVSGGKKISGNAQTRRGGVLLQHGTILHSVDVERMFSLLRVSDEKIRDKMIATVKDRVTSVSELSGASRDSLYRALVQGFTEGKEFAFDSLTPEEVARAHALALERYRTGEWNRMR